jgi:hypothetical protein
MGATIANSAGIPPRRDDVSLTGIGVNSAAGRRERGIGGERAAARIVRTFCLQTPGG